MLKKGLTLEFPVERMRAARYEAARRHISIRRLFAEWITPHLNQLPPSPYDVWQEEDSDGSEP